MPGLVKPLHGGVIEDANPVTEPTEEYLAMKAEARSIAAKNCNTRQSDVSVRTPSPRSAACAGATCEIQGRVDREVAAPPGRSLLV